MLEDLLVAARVDALCAAEEGLLLRRGRSERSRESRHTTATALPVVSAQRVQREQATPNADRLRASRSQWVA